MARIKTILPNFLPSFSIFSFCRKLYCTHHHHHWHNSPFWAKAFCRSFCQLSLFLAAFLQFLSPNFLASSITPLIERLPWMPFGISIFYLYHQHMPGVGQIHVPILRSLNCFIGCRISDSPAIASLDFVTIFFPEQVLSLMSNSQQSWRTDWIAS